MFSIVYDIALVIFFCLKLPQALYERFKKGKYRTNFANKFGFKIPEISPIKGKVIWIHAVSVGETKAAVALAKKFHIEGISLIISSGTETGHTVAKNSIPFAREHIYLPIDFRWVMYRLVSQIKPEMLIISETDYWYHLMRIAKKFKAKVTVVNGKLSEKTTTRYQKYRWFANHIFSQIDLFCVQNIVYADRYLSLGIERKKVVVTGNLKFDAAIPPMDKEFKTSLGLDEKERIVVIGSSHYPEEEQILERLEPLLDSVKILIVPRHPERFESVAKMLEKKGIVFSRFSKNKKTFQPQVILIDGMGVLRKCYQVADVAIVAGSFVQHVGGHNILEPGSYKVPVLFGPHMHSQPELLELVLENQAGLQTSLETLLNDVQKLLDDSDLRKKMGENAHAVIEKNQGATDKTYHLLLNL